MLPGIKNDLMYLLNSTDESGSLSSSLLDGKCMLIPVDVIETEAPVKLTDKNAEIFVYCRSGNRSVTASQALVELGYTNVYNLGGINDWPYETEAGAPK